MARSISRVVLLGGLLALATAAGGCRRGSTWPLAPVEGTVTKEGRPQGGIQVIFLPDAGGPRSSGITDEAGHYRLRTDGGDDSAVVGPYRVCLHDIGKGARRLLNHLPKKATNTKEIREKVVKQLKNEKLSSPRVPPSYSRPNETPLHVEVHPGPQVIDLEVK